MSTASALDVQPPGEAEDQLTPIPESLRTTKVSGQFWIWAGANTAPINWILGALGVQLGLGLWETIAILAVGNVVGMCLFGLIVLVGQRTGLTGMMLSKWVFGRVGNVVPAVIQCIVGLGWCAINTWVILDLVLALLEQIGWAVTGPASIVVQLVVSLLIMGAQVAIALLGYKAIAAFERWTVPITAAVMLAMTVAAWGFIGIDWNYAGDASLQGADRWSAITTVMTAIGVGWGFTWFAYAADYSRFVSTSVPRRKLFRASVLGQIVPVLWLGTLGATLATKDPTADPGHLLASTFGWLSIPILFLVLHGPLATNTLNIYSFSVSLQSLGVRISRRVITYLVGVVGLVGVAYLISANQFANTLSVWLGGIAMWASVWGGIMIIHYWIVEPRRTDFSGLFDAGGHTLPAVNVRAVVAFCLGLIAAWLCSYGGLEIFQGPIATALGGVDFSWLSGFVVASATYAALALPTRTRN